MKSLRDIDTRNKRILVRSDFNVPLAKNGKVAPKGDWRLKASLPTIKYLLKQKAKIILLSHLDRPQGKVVEKLRLNPIAEKLEKFLGQSITKLDQCFGQEVEQKVNNLQQRKIILLENLRFYPGEEENNPDFAKRLARLGDVYVNDAFSVSHRNHASIVGLPQYLPSCAGLLFEEEIKTLKKFLKEPKHPLLVIVGGAKISTKLKLIKHFLKKADKLILGGALANTVLKARGFKVGRSIIEKEMIEEAKKLVLTKGKVYLPIDAVVSTDISGRAKSRNVSIDKVKEEELILDIGPETTRLFKEIISQARMIIWNGPMGLFEVGKFNSGSEETAKAVAQSSAFSMVGGGDTIVLLKQLDLFDKIDHVSTGGGAMLSFLAEEKLPGLEVLREKNL
jgi:phosphoglycerate kinase